MNEKTEKIALRKAIDEAKWSPLAKVVLDYLARNPARLFRFDEVAEGVGAKRGDAEKAIAELRHPRNGAPLSNNAADGKKLRARYAFLPSDSPVRALYPPIEHPPAPSTPKATGRASRVKAGKNDVAVERQRFKDEKQAERFRRRQERKAVRSEMHRKRAESAAELRASRVKAREIFRAAGRTRAVAAPVAVPDPSPPPSSGTTRPSTKKHNDDDKDGFDA